MTQKICPNCKSLMYCIYSQYDENDKLIFVDYKCDNCGYYYLGDITNEG